MVEQKAAPAHAYDPLWNAGVKAKRGRWANIAIAVSIAVHGGLFYYVYVTKFAPNYRIYQDDKAVTAELMPRLAPPPPPPEPVKPPPVNREPPPTPAIAPHVAPLPPVSLGVPTVSIAPPETPLPPVPQAPPQEPAKPVQRVIANPDWSSRPNGEDVARFYPERAQRLEKTGNVTLQCQVTAKGTVTGCAVLSEDPVDFGFGDAALKLSRLFKMKPKMEDGQAVEGASVKIPIAFRIAAN